MKAVYPNLTAALGDPTGLAVLGVFMDVRQQRSTLNVISQSGFLLMSIFPAGRLRRQCPLWTHIPEAVLRGLQRFDL